MTNRRADQCHILPLAPPKDPLRAERMGLFRRGQWRIPKFSAKRLLRWQEIAALPPAAHVTGSPLMKQIQDPFDLLCACHCGITGIGDPANYARQTVLLVEHYFFGGWREGYVEDGETLTETTARKSLMWDTELRCGCAAALLLRDDVSVRRFLEYPRYDVYDEYIPHDLAYYRLLSDFVLDRSEWDWSRQTEIIHKHGDDQDLKLLHSLAALRSGDEAAFRKTILKFATKPKFTPPFAYSGVIDPDVTILTSLAHAKGWNCEDFPDRLRDKILSLTSIS